MTNKAVKLDLFAGLEKHRVSGSAAQRAGLYYERRVTRWFEKQYQCVSQPWLFPGLRPDLLVFAPGGWWCVVVEIKHQLVPEAFSQVERYAKWLKLGLPFSKVRSLVVCEQALQVPSDVTYVASRDLFNLSVKRKNLLLLSRRELRLGAGFAGEEDGSELDREGSNAPGGKPRGTGNVVRGGFRVCGVAAEVGAGGS